MFAGRRSTDKLYLVLQNAFCARALKGYAGTSSVYAVEVLDRVLGRQGVSEQRRREILGEWSATVQSQPCGQGRLSESCCRAPS